MPKQKGIVKIEGSIDDLTFYQTQDGSLLRKKTSVDKDRIENDAHFLRTRENNAEFTNAANASKLLRDALLAMSDDTAEGRVYPRLQKIMMEIKKLDTTSPRGSRTVANGIATAEAKELLEDFDMNINAPFSAVLKTDYKLDQATGNITFTGLIPQKNITYPDGATHVSLQAGFAKLDFNGNEKELQVSPETLLPIDKTSSDIVLKPAAVPSLGGSGIYVLKLFFYQMVNGVQYELQNGANNSMAIIAVS